MTPIKYHEGAEVELLNEIGYLELRAKGLGRRFFAEARRVLRPGGVIALADAEAVAAAGARAAELRAPRRPPHRPCR